MKKFVVSFLCTVMLFGMLMPLSVGAQAESPDSALDGNLVIHYDFEGATPEEQLSDKATAGVSKENLSLVSTKDPDTQKDLSYVKDGYAHVDHNINNYMRVTFNAKENVGTDVWNCKDKGEMTVFLSVKASGSPQAWATFLDFGKTVRMLLKGSKDNQAIFSTIGIRGGLTMNDNDKIDFPVRSADMILGADVANIAVTYEYDATTKKLVGSAYVSLDGGQTYSECLKIFEEIDEFFPSASHIMFGKTMGGNQFKRFDHGTSYDFYDFRVYNKALSLDQVKTIRTGDEPAAPETTVPEETTAVPTTQAPVTTAKPVTDKPADVTEAPKATTEVTAEKEEKKSGCKSALPFGGLAVILSASLAAAVLSKKKH